MTTAVFVANLLVSTVALIAATVDAYPDRERLAFLSVAVPYGVALEQLVILRFDRYGYPAGDFLLTVADVPVVIGFGWAAIIYGGYRIAGEVGVSRRALPAFVGLFALHIDLAIDAVAIRVPFWTWTPPGVWFGVPLGNFLGWFLVAFLFVGCWVGLERRVGRPFLRASAAAVTAVVGLLALLEAWEWAATTLPRKVVVLGVVLAGAAWLVATDGINPTRLPRSVASVPILYHGFYLALLVRLGLHETQPLLLVVSLAMVAVTVALHAAHLRAPRGTTATR